MIDPNEKTPVSSGEEPRRRRAVRDLSSLKKQEEELKNQAAPEEALEKEAPEEEAPEEAPKEPEKPLASGSAEEKKRKPAPVVSEKRQKKKISAFSITLIVVFTLLTAALIVGLVILRSVLTSYEASQPIHKAEEVFDTYFAARKFTEVVRLSGVEISKYESEEEVAALLQAMADGRELIFYPVSSAENEMDYAVSAVDPDEKTGEEAVPTGLEVVNPVAKLATMNFKRSETPGEYGFYSYEFKGISLEIAPKEKVAVRIPSDYVLSVNGVEVPENPEDTFEPLIFNDYLPDGVPGIYYTKYEIKDLYQTPILTCKNKAGREMELVPDENGVYTASLTYDETLKNELQDTVIAAVKAYMQRVSDDGGMGPVARYWDTSSVYYRQILLNPAIWVWNHDGNRFKDEMTENYLRFDENTFCCHVKMTQILYRAGSEDVYYYFDEILFWKKNPQGIWKVYDHILEGAVSG